MPRAVAAAGANANARTSGPITNTRLVVSNLHYEVTPNDLSVSVLSRFELCFFEGAGADGDVGRGLCVGDRAVEAIGRGRSRRTWCGLTDRRWHAEDGDESIVGAVLVKGADL